MNGMAIFHQFKQHYSRLWFEYEKGVDSLKTYGMSIVDNKRKHAGDEPNIQGGNKGNPKIIDNSNKNGGKENGGKKERREKYNRDKGDKIKCFRCNRFLTTADRCKEGQTPHTAENCFLKDHPDANKDPSKMYSDTKAFHELKKKYPNHNFISPNITSSGEEWSWTGQKGKRSDNNSAGKAGGKKNGEFNLCANINDDSPSDFLSCFISTFQEKVATNGGSAGPVGIFKILALLDQGSLAGSGDFISEATVDRMNASNFITFIDNQKLVCAGVDTNACYAPKGNIKIQLSFVCEISKDIITIILNPRILTFLAVDLIIGRKSIKRYSLVHHHPSHFLSEDDIRQGFGQQLDTRKTPSGGRQSGVSSATKATSKNTDTRLEIIDVEIKRSNILNTIMNKKSGPWSY
jgi:hypothetical protein